ncbi:MAG: prolyl oligopeptidase family serine peptidase, partial [Planctomycetaceae bacterium]
MTHASFLAAHSKNRKPSRLDRVVLEVFGRGNVAYRWAGETDVFEAMEALWNRETARGRVKLLDPDRVVLKGFSMGGAGTWHLGLHHPDRWTAIQPGAGFTNTIGYAKTLPEKLPEWQSRILTLYDAQASSANACMVPVVAYSGGDDPQIDAARRIEQSLKGWTGNPPLRFAHIVAP